MGTNFYLQRIPTEEEQKIMDEIRQNKKWEDDLGGFLDQITEEIHICKRSSGWFICFDHNNGRFWDPSRKSLEEWLKKPEYVIKDEYGEEYTPSQFWEMVDSWNTSKPDLWDSEAYEKWERERNPNYYSPQCTGDKDFCARKFGIITKNNDFKVDGLRFAVWTDFS